MKKLLWSIFVLIMLLIFIGLASCIETGDEERPGMAVDTDLLLTKIWEVELFQDDGRNKSGLFHNVFLEFRPNFVFRITKGCDILDGEWILSSDSTLLVIRIPGSTEPFTQLEDEWVITKLTDTEIHLIEQDNKGDEEFLLKVAPLSSLKCQTCDNLNHLLTDGVWSIASFITPGQELTEASKGAYLDFNSNGEVMLHTDDQVVDGSWVLTDQCQTLVIQWFSDKPYADLPLELEDHWFIHGISQQSMMLETEDRDQLELAKGRFKDCADLQTTMSNTSWSINRVIINDDDVSDNFWGTGLTLLAENKLATEVLIGPSVLGQWMLSGDCNRLIIDIQAGQLKDLSREWTIVELSEELIKLEYQEGAIRMEMELKKGQPRPTANCLVFIDLLVNSQWSVIKFEENQIDGDPALLEYFLQFSEDGTVVVWNNEKEITGKWYPLVDCQSMVIDLDRQSSAGKFAGKWAIDRSYNDRIIMVYEKTDQKRTVELKVM